MDAIAAYLFGSAATMLAVYGWVTLAAQGVNGNPRDFIALGLWAAPGAMLALHVHYVAQ